ncbi:MAG: hypothetical protein P4L43_03935 [Syntrophobacteraceae bacterium]|nr:hypothetical protein [Syntrophobacteraceae bacterium]
MRILSQAERWSNGFSFRLTKNVLQGGYYSGPLGGSLDDAQRVAGALVDSPFLSRATCITRLSVSTCSSCKAQTMPEHHRQQTTVAGFKAEALGGAHKLFHLARREVFSVVYLFSRLGSRRFIVAFKHGA